MAQGLSHAPYLLAESPSASVTFAATPSRLTFQVRAPGLRLATDTTSRTSSRRGTVREFSHRSRRRLREVAWDLSEMWRAEVLVTLTMPGEWASVCADGRAFKRHVKAWRARLGRHLAGLGVGGWAALWFLEFQARGAPHLHVLFFGDGIGSVSIGDFRTWASESWSEVVGHLDEQERAKHLQAGTRVERMRTGHFGYATKYATKMQQKNVPPEFRSVGRFWGLWQHRAPSPAVWCHTFSLADVERLVGVLAATLPEHVPTRERLPLRFQQAAPRSDTFTATVYGTAAVWAAVDFLASDAASSVAAPPEPRSGPGSGLRRRRGGRTRSGAGTRRSTRAKVGA
jgi:hypothetical protein